MRQTIHLLLALLLGLASPAGARGISIDPSKRYEFTDCAAAGSTAQTVAEGVYLTRFLTEDIWVCYAGTCGTGGEKFGAGTVMMLSIGRGGQLMSCRSSGSTGDLVLTGANQ